MQIMERPIFTSRFFAPPHTRIGRGRTLIFLINPFQSTTVLAPTERAKQRKPLTQSYGSASVDRRAVEMGKRGFFEARLLFAERTGFLYRLRGN